MPGFVLEEVKPFLKTWSLRNTWRYKSNGRLLEEVDTVPLSWFSGSEQGQADD